jgi:hypothetical protein
MYEGSELMKIIKQLSLKNDCYQLNQKMNVKGLVLHSVGCNQSRASVFANTWNKPNYEVAVHGVLQADGTVIQCLEWNQVGWHCAGSLNQSHIGIEMTEPDCIKYIGSATFTCSNLTEARNQVKGTYNTAVELFAYLCKKFNLDPLKDGVILSHYEAGRKGLASGHEDPEHLWRQLGLGYTMNGFRKAVKTAMSNTSVQKTLYRVRKTWTNSASQIGAYVNLSNAQKACDKAGKSYSVFDANGNKVYPTTTQSYRVKVVVDALNIRSGPSTQYKINGCIRDYGVYTIIETKNGFGRLKSNAGWICLDYTTKI